MVYITKETDGRTILNDGFVITETRDLNLNIQDLKIYKSSVYVDDRGFVMEAYRKNYFLGNGPVEQVYFASVLKGTVKGFHCHKIHKDRLFVVTGRVKMGFIDMREESQYYGLSDSITIDSKLNPCLIEVPPMLYHGMIGISEESIVMNISTHIFDPSDEIKIDPASVSFDWSTKNR